MAGQHDFLAMMAALEQGGHPFVVYRPAGGDTVRVLIDGDKSLRVLSDAGTQRGFVFAPFASDTVPAVWLSPSATMSFPAADLPRTRTAEIPDEAYGDEITRKQHYMQLVERAKAEMDEGTIRKIVTSRCVRVPYASLNVAGIFAALAGQYPGSFVYFFSHPRIGQWMGATPELLLLRRGDAVHTMSLAGTLPYDGQQMYRWDAKNVEEQAIVSVFIKDALERSGVAAVSVSKPGNQLAGPVVHLCSHISGQATAAMDMNALLKNLAPTPALCGYPRRESMDFIRRYEGYPREFYGGYLGELNLDAERSAELYVNIRCMQITGQEIILYAGGGITLASDAEAEWGETDRKLRTLGSVIGGFIEL